MTDPVTAAIGGVGIISSIFGSATQAAGAQQQAQAQTQMYNYQAGVAKINQQISLQNADYARQLGEQQSQQYGMQAGQQMGQIKAAQASSGLDVNSGSAKLVRQSQAKVTSMGLDQIRANAAKTAYDYDVQSTQAGNQAQIYQMSGANAAAAGNINVASSIIGGASSVSTKWLQGQSMGIWGSAGGGGGNNIFGAPTSAPVGGWG